MSGMMPRKSKPASNNPGERLADWQGEKQTANPLVGHVQASGSPSNSSSEQENNQSFVSDNSMMMAMSDAEDLRRERENNTKGEKKSSCGNIAVDPKQPKTVMITQPGQKTPKPTISSKKSAVKSDVDVTKEFKKCKEEDRKRLDLSKSQITVIPQSVKELTQLQEFYLYGNRLGTLPPEIGCLTNLLKLGLSENSLTTLPESLQNLKHLKVLDLRHNRLNERLPTSIGNLKKLRVLDLEENKLEQLPQEIGQLRELTRLVVQSNQLVNLPSAIGYLTKLEYLGAGENKLTSLPAEIGTLKSLESLYINDNQDLHSLPYELVLCGNLQIMSIENCPLSQIPPEIVAKGPSLVIQNLKGIEEFTKMRLRFIFIACLRMHLSVKDVDVVRPTAAGSCYG
ncbi:hypothetical protein KUTeg_023292 [Tegillarca granosa]|uniref:Disease resistance R13L4/SHOC-2-like LRR domain-containing protein n=1 Tax=Tegillarca granosa TaxID=220873 RepID=A0ABQ9E6R6_TEGGR|nr:hypothetical protein KUTeg_023292 [Tegillarca granosa]